MPRRQRSCGNKNSGTYPHMAAVWAFKMPKTWELWTKRAGKCPKLENCGQNGQENVRNGTENARAGSGICRICAGAKR